MGTNTKILFALMVLSVSTVIIAEEPVYFKDLHLKAAVEETLQVAEPTPTDLLGLTRLTRIGNEWFPEESDVITDLTGLEYALNLQKLFLRLNRIGNISALSGLIKLQELDLSRNNHIWDISPLGGLTHLRYLDIHENVISDISPLSGLSLLNYLDIHRNYFKDLSPLSDLTALQKLIAFECQISDITPLSKLTQLTYLHLGYNQIHSVTALKDISKLGELHLEYNQIEDITGLLELSDLRKIDLRQNPLNRTAYQEHLYVILNRNPDVDLQYDPNPQPPEHVVASAGAYGDRIIVSWDPVYGGPYYTTYYRVSRSETDSETEPVSLWRRSPEFEDVTVKNGMIYHYTVQTAFTQEGADPGDMSESAAGWLSGTPVLQLSSSAGGFVSEPGEGVYVSSPGEIRPVVAESMDLNLFLFSGWTGSAVEAGKVTKSNDASTMVTVDDSFTLHAQFITTQTVLYVDDDTKGDPQENGTQQHPFDSIQEAIDVAVDGVAIIVYPGIYEETLDLLGKEILLTGFDLNAEDPLGDSMLLPLPVIDGSGGVGPVVSFTHEEGEDCVLRGFVLTRGQGGILCQGANPTIQNCLVVGNAGTVPEGGAVSLVDSRANLINCTIAQNIGPDLGGGLMLARSDITLMNSILWENVPMDMIIDPESNPSVRYNSIGTKAAGEQLNESNLNSDPLFVKLGERRVLGGIYWKDGPGHRILPFEIGDYHLTSRAARWDQVGLQWVQDLVTSPCIDSGYPGSPIGVEPEPNGGIINMGAYGGTHQASSGE